jgi:hypothetical protein
LHVNFFIQLIVKQGPNDQTKNYFKSSNNLMFVSKHIILLFYVVT